MRSLRSYFNGLQPREQRAVGALAAAVLLILVFQFAIFPMMDLVDKNRAELPLKQKRLRKYRGLVSLIGAAETDWKALEQRLVQAEKGLLDSRTAALAAAELQDHAKELLKQQGIEPRGVSFMAVKALAPPDSGYSAVPLSLSFECSVDQLANLLASFQSDSKTLAVDSLYLEAVPVRADKTRKVVGVRMAIRAVMFSEPPSQQPGAGRPS